MQTINSIVADMPPPDPTLQIVDFDSAVAGARILVALHKGSAVAIFHGDFEFGLLLCNGDFDAIEREARAASQGQTT